MLGTRDSSHWTQVRIAILSKNGFCCEPRPDFPGVALYHPGRAYRYRCRRLHTGRATLRKHAESRLIFSGAVDRIHPRHCSIGETQPQSRPSGTGSWERIPVPLPSPLNERPAIHHSIFGVRRTQALGVEEGGVHWKQRCLPPGPGLAG